MLWLPRFPVIVLESTGMGGDRSINSLYSRRLLTSSSLFKELEKRKEKKRNPEVIGGEGNEIGEVKIKEK